MEIPFDGILTLLVFLVGIPALILQLISASERRAVLKKERLDVKSFLIKALAVVLIGLILQFCFMFLLKNCDGTIRNFIEQVIWLFIFGGLFYLVFQVSKQIPEQFGRRERIIEKLTQDIIQETKNKERIAGSTFNDLANLGKQCDPGQEREMVLDAFTKLVKATLKKPEYKGDSFEALIDELVHILASNPEPKDLGNYDVAIKVLSAILSADNAYMVDDDRQRAVHAISKLGQTLIVHFKSVERDNIILDYIDSLEFALTKEKMLTEVSQALFEIGICAVKEDQDFVTVAILDKMTALAENHLPLPDEFTADLLGLVAFFWSRGGSRKAFADTKLGEVEKFFSKDVWSALNDARIHCTKTMYFDVADRLSDLLDARSKPKRPSRQKKK
jgi:hypothetical protein